MTTIVSKLSKGDRFNYNGEVWEVTSDSHWCYRVNARTVNREHNLGRGFQLGIMVEKV